VECKGKIFALTINKKAKPV